MSHWETAGKTSEWYTPSYIFEAIGEHFDWDVASPEAGPLHVPCDQWIYEDALTREWEGFVWMNPPFGGRNSLEPWLTKFFDHGNGIALTPDRSSAPWFTKSWRRAHAVLFISPKVRFLRPDGTPGDSPSTGTALWAVGYRAVLALCNASRNGLGIIALPVIHTKV